MSTLLSTRLSCLLVASILASLPFVAGATGDGPTGYAIGRVVSAYDEHDGNRCWRYILLEVYHHEGTPLADRAVFRSPGATCGENVKLSYALGSDRMFSIAAREIALLTYEPGPDGRLYVVDKGTLWCSDLRRNLDGVRQFLQRVVEEEAAEGDFGGFEVYRGFSLDILASPAPDSDETTRKLGLDDVWFLPQTFSPSETVEEYVSYLSWVH